MASNFFIDKKLKKKIEKDIKKREDIEDALDKLQKERKKVDASINEDLENFYKQVDNSTVISTLKYYEQHSKKKKKRVVKEIEKRYKNSSLLIEDTLKLTDLYEQMCDDYNNKI